MGHGSLAVAVPVHTTIEVVAPVVEYAGLLDGLDLLPNTFVNNLTSGDMSVLGVRRLDDKSLDLLLNGNGKFQVISRLFLRPTMLTLVAIRSVVRGQEVGKRDFRSEGEDCAEEPWILELVVEPSCYFWFTHCFGRLYESLQRIFVFEVRKLSESLVLLRRDVLLESMNTAERINEWWT